MRAAVVKASLLALVAGAGCYDVDGLRSGERGLRIVATDSHGLSTGAHIEQHLVEVGPGDLLLLALEVQLGVPLPVALAPEWTLVRSLQTCPGGLQIFHRIAASPADGDFTVEYPNAEASLAVRTVAVRGVDRAVPFGPITAAYGDLHTLDIAPPTTPEQRWIAIGGAQGGTASYRIAGMQEVMSDGWLSVLFGVPAIVDGAVAFASTAPSVCSEIVVAALDPS